MKRRRLLISRVKPRYRHMLDSPVAGVATWELVNNAPTWPAYWFSPGPHA